MNYANRIDNTMTDIDGLGSCLQVVYIFLEVSLFSENIFKLVVKHCYLILYFSSLDETQIL